MSSDLTFITNEQGQHLGDRFGVLLGEDTRFFDCLVGYFFISGFHRLHPALTKTEKVRILIGIKTDGATYELIQSARAQQEFVLESHAQVRERVPGEILAEFQKSGDSVQIEDGVRKFVEWIRSGKLEVRAYPSERVHAKLYIMTFHEDDRDKGRVITGSSNFTEAGLQGNLEFNVELKNRSDYEFALQKFNELWAKSVDVTKDYITTIEVKSPFAQFTPYELYELLAQITRGKRVVLVSATPLNNTPQDILSQIKLFQPGKNSTIPNVRNLEAFFGALRRRLEGLDRQRDRDQYFKIVRENARQTREKILKFLMIRRTRTEIERYYGEDLKQQGLKFPEVANPEPLFYKFNKIEAEVFDETIRSLTHDFKYARYTPLAYYTGERDEQDIQSQRNLAKFMKILTVKRLESSFTAFLSTLGRFIHTYERVIAEFQKGHVFISKKHIGKVFELLESDDQEGIDRLLEEDKAEKLAARDFLPTFITDLENDLKALKAIRNQWKKVTRDPKWESFRAILKKTPQLKDGKLIIFTESKETADYLAGKIRDEVEPKTLLFTGESLHSVREDVIANFDAKAYRPKDDYRILVATEVLAEGVNLHRSNVVINYDIPWNPTRLIQRVGRVNRVDTKFDTIHTYNFFPTDEGNDLIKLREAAEAKIHAFIQMLGADARLLTEGEEIVSHDLFARWNSKKTITGEDEDEETELKFLTEIRTVRDKQPDVFERIKRLPRKARSTRTFGSRSSGRESAQTSTPESQSRLTSAATGDGSIPSFPALLTYFRQGKLDKFFLGATGSQPTAELDFMAAAKILKPADPKETRQSIPREFYDLLDKNKGAFVTATTADAEQAASTHRGSPNDAYILKRLKDKAVRRCQQFTEDDEEFVGKVIRLVEDGSLPKATAKKVAAALKQQIEPLKILDVLRRNVKHEYFQTSPAAHASQALTPREIILSSYLIQAP